MTVPTDLDRRFRDAAVEARLLDAGYDVVDTPVGPLLVAATDRGLLRVSFDGTAVFDGGAPTGLVPTLEGADARIELDLGLGDGECAYLASDLSYDYVRLNAEYTT